MEENHKAGKNDGGAGKEKKKMEDRSTRRGVTGGSERTFDQYDL